MTTYFRAKIAEVGLEVAELLDGGLLILYALGAPPELAEVSVLHVVEEGPTAEPPPIGALLKIGQETLPITAIGSSAWHKVGDIGHVVINFNGAAVTERPGEICVATVDTKSLGASLVAGAPIAIERG